MIFRVKIYEIADIMMGGDGHRVRQTSKPRISCEIPKNYGSPKKVFPKKVISPYTNRNKSYQNVVFPKIFKAVLFVDQVPGKSRKTARFENLVFAGVPSFLKHVIVS